MISKIRNRVGVQDGQAGTVVISAKQIIPIIRVLHLGPRKRKRKPAFLFLCVCVWPLHRCSLKRSVRFRFADFSVIHPAVSM